MALPLYLAMTASEMSSTDGFPPHFSYMACHFSPYSQGLSNLPEHLPDRSMLILNDNFPCQGHSPGLVVQQLSGVMEKFCCESLLLDFQRPPEPEAEAMVSAILQALPCPTAVTPEFATDHHGPVFLPPCPLHIPLEEYLTPWKSRELWLEAALCQESAIVSKDGAVFCPHFPAEGLEDGFYDEGLACRYHVEVSPESITFTLFDARDSLSKKLEKAHSLGVSRAVGLWQELGTFGKPA